MVEPATAPPPTKAGRNERRKAMATTLNAISVAVLVTMVIQPAATNHFSGAGFPLAVFAFLVLQLLLHYVLGRVED